MRRAVRVFVLGAMVGRSVCLLTLGLLVMMLLILQSYS